MSPAWLKNFLGLAAGEDESPYISEPAGEIGIHATFKAVQGGSVFGVGVVGPLIALSQPGLSLSSVARMAGRCGQTAALCGLVLGPAVALYGTRALSAEDRADMCRRLRRHEQQLTIDRMSAAGLGAGYTVGKLVRRNAGHFGVVGLVAALVAGECFTSSGVMHL